MAGTYSNPTNAAYLADLGITIKPAPALHGNTWRPHPILSYIPISSVARGRTGDGIRTIADISAITAFSENTALTDQAAPTISSVNPTLVGRGYSYSETSQGRNRISDSDYARFEAIRMRLIERAILDDISHGSTNGVVALSSSVTDITTDAGANATLGSLLEGAAAVGRPFVAFYDAIGIRGLMEDIQASGSMWASEGLSDQVRRFAEKWDPTILRENGLVLELFGGKVFQTNDRSGDASRLYENGANTHAMIMADMKVRAASAAGGMQMDLTAFPIMLQGRRDPVPNLPAVQQPEIWLSLQSGVNAEDFDFGAGTQIDVASWFDLSNAVAGYKKDFGLEFDPILTNSGYIRCIQYSTTWV